MLPEKLKNKECDEIWFGSFNLFDLNLSMKSVKKFFVEKCTLCLVLLSCLQETVGHFIFLASEKRESRTFNTAAINIVRILRVIIAAIIIIILTIINVIFFFSSLP